MKSSRLPRVSSVLPRRGHVLVSVSVVDENGFTMEFETMETPTGAFRDGLAMMHLSDSGLSDKQQASA